MDHGHNGFWKIGTSVLYDLIIRTPRMSVHKGLWLITLIFKTQSLSPYKSNLFTTRHMT